MKHNTIKITICLLSFFSATQCMDTPVTDIIQKKDLQTFISHLNKRSLCMVEFIQTQAQKSNIPLTPANIPHFIGLSQDDIDQIFLTTVDDDAQRPLMLEMGANVKALTSHGENCLFMTKKPEVLRQLIKLGAEVNCVSKANSTPLYKHCYYHHTEQSETNEIARVLLEAGASVVNTDYSISLLHQAVEKGNAVLTQLLCDHKADIHEKDSLGRSLLMQAIPTESLDVITILLNSGINADTSDDFNRYPLHLAIPEKEKYGGLYDKKRHAIPAIVALLLQHGANPNRPYPHTAGQNFPLHRAVEIKNLAIITALLKHGAETHHQNQSGHMPLALAKLIGCSPEIITLLTAHTAAPVFAKASDFAKASTDASSGSANQEPLTQPKPQTRSWLDGWW